MLKKAQIDGEWEDHDDGLTPDIEKLAFAYWQLRKSILHGEFELGVRRGIDNLIDLGMSGPGAPLYVR